MRITKSKVPSKELDEALYSYYELDSSLNNYSSDDDIRNLVKGSIYNDYGYDVYGVFDDPSDKNFINYEDVYANRINDFAMFCIASYSDTVQADMDKITSLKNFSKSALYKKICKATPDNIERCKKLFEVSSGGGNAMNFANTAVGRDFDNQKNSPKNKLDFVSEMSNVIEDSEKCEKLKKSIDDNENLGDDKKKELKKTIDDFKSGGLLAGKGASKIFQAFQDIIQGIDWSSYFLLNMGNKLSVINTFKSSNEFTSANFPAEDIEVKNIEHSEEVMRANSSEIAMDDDTFYRRFANKELVVRGHLQERKRMQAFYVLIDVSGSMAGIKETFARSAVIELLSRVVKGKAKYFLRTFDDTVYDLKEATTEEEAETVKEYIKRTNFSGGGTDIDKALRYAISDLRDDKKKFEDMDILIITDGQDSISVSKKDLKGIKLHSFCLHHSNTPDEKVIKKQIQGIEEDIKNSTFKSDADSTTEYGMKGLAAISDTFEIVSPLLEIKKVNKELFTASGLGIGPQL